MKPDDFEIVELGDPRLRQVARAVDVADLTSALAYADILQYWMDQRGGVGAGSSLESISERFQVSVKALAEALAPALARLEELLAAL